jgi:phosphopantetheine adenylyltransferase
MDHMKLVLNNGVEINRQCMVSLIQDDFANTKGVIRIRKSTKNRKRNVQKKIYLFYAVSLTFYSLLNPHGVCINHDDSTDVHCT